MATVDLTSSFLLRLDDGTTVPFKAGIQDVDPVFLQHWFFASHVRGAARRVAPGTAEYADQDKIFAQQIEAETAAHAAKIAQLQALRTAHQSREIQDAMTMQRPGLTDDADLTPIQRQLRDAARRQAQRQAQATAATATGVEAPPPGGESHNHGNGPVQENKGADIGIHAGVDPLPGGDGSRNADDVQARPREETPPGGGTDSTNPHDGSGTDDTGGVDPAQQAEGTGRPKLGKPVL
jgi:hypothetical protein